MRLIGNSSPVIRRMERYKDLSTIELEKLSDIPVIVREFAKGSDFVHNGDRTDHSCLIISGLACRYRIVLSGERQIFSFHVPGEMPDLDGLLTSKVDYSLRAVSASKIGFVPHWALKRVVDEHPNVARYFWRKTLTEGRRYREWLCSLGRRTAVSRVAHLICEMWYKTKDAGLSVDNSMFFPITQAEVADSVGLSAVYVNRAFGSLRRRGLIITGKNVITVPDIAKLLMIAEFEDHYREVCT